MRAPQNHKALEVQVGLFVIVVALIVAAFSFKMTSSPLYFKGTELIAYYDDTVGLYQYSKVKLAGIDIGRIEDISLEGRRAKVTVKIRSDVELPKGSKLVPRPLNLLGDKFLEVVLPKLEGSSLLKRRPSRLLSFFFKEAYGQSRSNKKVQIYKSGEVISSEDNSATLDDLSRQMIRVGDDLKETTDSLKTLVAGKANSDSSLGVILSNLETVSKDLKFLTQGNKVELTETVHIMSKLSRRLDVMTSSFSQDKMSKDIKALADSSANLGRSLEHITDILSKVNGGDGTVSQLLNNPAIALQLEEMLRSVNLVLTKAKRTQTNVLLRPEYDFSNKTSKIYAGLAFKPREDRGYLFQVVVDKAGSTKKERITEVVNGGTPTVKVIETNKESAFKVNFQLQKRIWDLVLRAGLFENKGGLAFDYHIVDKVWSVGSEFYDFDRVSNRPIVKAYTRLRLFRHIELSAGAHDLITNSNSKIGYFIGLGLNFNDQDLASFLGLATAF